MKRVVFAMLLFVSFGIQEVVASNALPPPNDLLLLIDDPSIDNIGIEEAVTLIAPDCYIHTVLCGNCGISITFQNCVGEGSVHPPLEIQVMNLCAQACGGNANG
jgi:hypothetical protein